VAVRGISSDVFPDVLGAESGAIVRIDAISAQVGAFHPFLR
jgi:hypothetical protein